MKNLSLTACVLAACAAGLYAQQGPTPEMRARLTGLTRALTTFDPKTPETIDKLRDEAFTADLRARLSVEQVRSLAARMRQDFGTFTIGEVRRRDPETIVPHGLG